MSQNPYKWKRFWRSIDGNLQLDYRGFLENPEAEYGRFINPDVVPFSSICNIPCLVLLGEPGMGKTTTVKCEYQQLDEQIARTQDSCLWFNLGDYGSDSALCDAIFKHEVFQAWLNGTHQLHLFLDSLDEGLLSLQILGRLLKREIDKLPSDRLYFRITCRTADWLDSLEQKLKEKWGEANVGIYELAPLRQIDIVTAAEQKAVNSDQFLEEIVTREATPLAIKPVTLNFLISYYSKNQQFPASQKELYERGCLELCKELNPNRHESGFRGSLSEKQRLIVAGRIATSLVFAKRAAVWISPDCRNMPDSDIALSDLIGGQEFIDNLKFSVEEKSIREVFSITGLFSSRGTHRMGFAHQTYAEFLAAWYLTQYKLPLIQVMSLFVSPDDSERKLIPQLHETAAWLASMRTDIFQEIIKTDPDVLLRSDIPQDANLRAAIIENLLQQYVQENLDFRNEYKYRGYKKLAHSNLLEQLCPYILDSRKNLEARCEAINIAESCEVRELQEDLVNLAIDSSQPIYLRANAVRAVGSIGNLETRLKLKTLAIDELVEDEDDRLKGYSLSTLWPDGLTAEELFSVLTPPKRRNFTGNYQRFIDYELVPKLKTSDLLIAINWLEKQRLRCLGHPFEYLGNAILLKAWEHFNLFGVAESFAKIALIQWNEYQPIIASLTSSCKQFDSRLANDDEKRRQLINCIVQEITETQIEPDFLFSSAVENAFLEKDTIWAIDKAQISQIEREQKVWANIIARIFNRQDAKQIDALIIAIQTHNILREELFFYFEAVELGTAQAEAMKFNYLEMQASVNSRRENQLLDPLPRERVLLWIEQLEAGELSAWWQLNREMTLKPDSRNYGDELKLDLTKLPGWEDASLTTRQRIIEGAKKYIQEENEVSYSWIGTNTYNRPALAGCRAFQLLFKEFPDFLNSLSTEIWKRWTPVIIGYPNNGQERKDYLKLVKIAYLKSPSEAIATLMQLVERENEESHYIWAIEKFEKCWDEPLRLALLEKVIQPSLKPQCMGQLLEELLKRESNEAREFAKSLLSLPLLSEKESRQKAVFAAKALVECTEPSSWLFLWSVIQQDTSFGREVIESAASVHSHGIYLSLTEKQMADLYIWLVQQYPHNEDPVYKEAHSVGVRESVAGFRNSILTQLKDKGTSQACVEIQRIAQTFPELKWLKMYWLEAQVIKRRNSWEPPTPSEILLLISEREKRFVQDGNQLLDVLIETLKNLELELQGETSAARDVWDRVRKHTFKPVNENEFSNYVKRYLEKRLKSNAIIVNREVELRPNTGNRPGERTDIHVNAVIRNSTGEIFDKITVIIEVKGCWHQDLDNAMETQLVNRYLQDNTCQHGLYLIGWFDCPQWDNGDSRQRTSPRIPLEAAREQFNRQANELSLPAGVQVKAFVLNAALR